MAEGQRRLPLGGGLGTTLGGLSEHRLVAFGLQWYGVPLAAFFGLFAAVFYAIAPEQTRPLFDDSYISLNFARNIVEHGKLSFDGEAWTTGATSPLHVLVMAFLLWVGFDPFVVSVYLGVVGHVLLAVGVYLMAVAIFHSRLAGILAALAISFTGFAALDAGNGLETSLFMALLAFAGAAYFWSERPAFRIACGVFIGLAVLTRPEGALLVPAILIYRWLERPAGQPLREYAKDALRLAVPGAIAGGAIVLFSLIVAGSIGGTGSAKLAFFQEDEASLQYKLTMASDQVGIFASPLLPLIALAAVAASRRQLLLVGLFWVPIFVFYVELFPGGLAHYFYRYQHPVLPFLAVFAGGGAAYLVTTALQRDLVAKLLVVAAFVLVVVPMYEQYDRWRDVYTTGSDEVYASLEAMALDINSIVEEDEVLASHDIGAVSYFADYTVLDIVGLVNDEVIPYHEDRRLEEYLELEKPDYLLMFAVWDPFFLHLNPAQHPERYELVKEYPGGVVQPHTYYLYRLHY